MHRTRKQRKTRKQNVRKQICSCSPDVGDCPKCHKVVYPRYKKTRSKKV